MSSLLGPIPLDDLLSKSQTIRNMRHTETKTNMRDAPNDVSESLTVLRSMPRSERKIEKTPTSSCWENMIGYHIGLSARF